jgi:hypothetical protein
VLRAPVNRQVQKRQKTCSQDSTQEAAARVQTLRGIEQRTLLRTRLNTAMALLHSEMVLTENAFGQLSIQAFSSLAATLDRAVQRMQQKPARKG